MSGGDYQAVIVGAGPAGLTAAHQLVRSGIRPLVLEKTDKIGGISRTEEYRGYRFDIGGHRFFTKMEEVNRLWDEMMGEDFISVLRKSHIYYRGEFFKYPIEIFNALEHLGITESVLVVLSYLKARIRPHHRATNLEEWVINHFGERLYRIFFKTYTEKVWGMPCHDIRAEWAAQRIKGLSLRTAVVNALFRGNQPKTLIREFHYPRLGPGMMWERFRGAVEAEDGKVLLKSPLVRLERRGNRVERAVARGEGGETVYAADHFISSMPLPELVRALDPPPPPEVLEAAADLSYRSFLMVGLILGREDLFDDQWIYINSSEVRVGRVQNFRNWSPAMVPEKGKSCLGMEYFCAEGDETWNTDDGELISLATRELARLGLADESDVEDGVIFRQPKAYTVYVVREHVNWAVSREFLSGLENIQAVGRNGLHYYNNMDHSMLTGILAVKNILGADHDIWAVNKEEEYHESGDAPEPS